MMLGAALIFPARSWLRYAASDSFAARHSEPNFEVSDPSSSEDYPCLGQ